MTRRSRSALFGAGAVVVAAAIALGGCTPGVARPPRTAAIPSGTDVEAQLFKLQKDTARILEQLDALENRDPADDPTGRVCAEAVTRLDAIERQVLALEQHLLDTRRRLDETVAEIRRYARAQRPRWTEPSALPPPVEPPAGDPLALPPDDDGASRGAAGPSAQSPSEMFDAAYADFSQGRYALALKEFEAVAEADPSGPLADDAQLWIGETLQALDRPLDAVRAYEHLIASYPDSELIRRAHLRKGLALFKARRATEAVLELESVIETWPESDEARIAEEYLEMHGVELR